MMRKLPKTIDQGPLVSVGLLTYQRTRGFKRALKSIISQTYKNLEIIVSENYSPDFEEKEKFVKKLLKKDKRIQYFRHKPNQGIYFNVNFVLQKATGKYFMWAADDDFWAPTFISELIHQLETHPEAGVAIGASRLLHQTIPSQTIRFSGRYNPNQKGYFSTFWAALHPARSKYLYFISGLYRRKLLQDVFFQTADFYTPDIMFIILFSLVAPLRYVDKILSFWGSADSTYRSEEIRNEINVFRWWGEISNPFKLGWTILGSPQVRLGQKFYIPVALAVLIFRLFMLVLIKILGYILSFLQFISAKIFKLNKFLVENYFCSK